jgi:AcrR family transcriptional regulator
VQRTRVSQRERLIAAAIAVTARYGYRETSIARIVAEAKVSRATYYEHFDGKEDCLLAAYRDVARRFWGDVRRVEAEDGDGGDDGLGGILARLLENADRDPAAARLFLIESLAGGPAVRAEHEQLLDALEESVDEYLCAPQRVVRLEIPARSLIGGVASVIAMRIFRGETGKLIELLDDLEAWLRSYSIPAGSERRDRVGWADLCRGSAPPVEPAESPLEERLPRGRGALSAAVVTSAQRQRVLAAVARVARDKGYEAMTVADIVTTAGIAREAFYRQFRGKEDAFLSAQAYALETSLSMAAEKFFAAEAWQDRVWSAALPMLEYIASVPDLTTLDFIESYTAGAAAIRRSFESRMAYTLFLEEGYRQRPEEEGVPRLASEAIAGAILELLRSCTVHGRIADIRELAPQAVYIALAPFIGPAAALELIEAKLSTPM